MLIARDAEDKLVFESEMAAGVLGRGEDFILVHLNDKPLDAAVLAEATAKGFAWCGVLGLLNGKPEVQLSPENPEAARTMCFAGLAFAHIIADHMRPQNPGDAVDWLTRLHALRDARPSEFGPN
jgi:hypothetical protein